ncbi:MAG: nitroreductase family protein [Candidatus Sumerlaeia bacterium]|nr:nitroreductase family protein [Candidatus Sumerlaeia bacterium]
MNAKTPPTIDEASLRNFEELARTRRSTRHFLQDPIPDGVLERLLECARWAPSGYNLQPLHVITVEDKALKERLAYACLDQAQVREAPVVTIFCGDLKVHRNNFEEMLAMEKEGGSVTEEYEAKLKKFVPLAFEKGPVGMNWLWKFALPPFMRFFTRIPDLPAVHSKRWLSKQVSLAAMNFMLAAHSAGLATVPMEGFDERRVRGVVKLPSSIFPVMIIPVGFDRDGGNHRKTRFDLTRIVHRNSW